MFVQIDELYINPDRIRYIKPDYRKRYLNDGTPETQFFGLNIYFDTVDGYEKPHAEQGNALRLTPEQSERFLYWLNNKADLSVW